MEYVLHIAVLVCIYAILAVSLDLVAGQAGLLSLAHGAFYGLGGYAAAVLSLRFGLPFPATLMCGALVAATLSVLASLPAVRLSGDAFVIALLGFQMLLSSVFRNWTEVTGGPVGISRIPAPRVGGLVLSTPFHFVVVAAALAGMTFLMIRRLVLSPYGRVLRAIREDERLALALAKDTLRFKMTAFAMSAGLAGTAGALYGHYVSYIDPSAFDVMQSIQVLAMVILGGSASVRGPVVGAGVLVALPEALRFVGVPAALLGNLRQVLYGLGLVLVLLAGPSGLVGRVSLRR
jgi:ABC-type branched-subunit amino acid transport system permease subunit